ncbi:hypothetical protein GEMRC1_004771 [Eukaryota sp. GEM-RC1]
MMVQMGTKKSVYHAVNYVWNFFIFFVVSLVLIFSGFFLDFPMFVRASLPFWFGLCFVWGHAVVALCQMFTAFFSKSKWCTFAMFFVSYFISDIGEGLMMVFDSGPHSKHWLTWIPSFGLVKIMRIVRTFTSPDQEGLVFADLYSSDYAIGSLLIRIMIGTVCIHIITLYLEVVLTNEFGAHHDWFFFVKPSFYKKIDEHEATKNLTPTLTGDADVDNEAQRAFNEVDNAVRVLNLQHRYPGADEEALKGVSFCAKRGETIGLCGSNGAGKSTLISALSGLFAATGGDAYINHTSIRDSMAEIYKILGICPQFDALWNVITGSDHLRFYARIKGYPASEIEGIVEEALKMVKLEGAGKKEAGQYSGGMRRRLSLAIALLGYKNKLSFLDECTTGVDVSTAAFIYDAIKSQQANKTVLLTSHSFEEINELSDRVIIMKDGRIAAIGTPLELKRKFGSGYKVSLVVTNEDCLKEVMEKVNARLEEVVVIGQLGVNLQFVCSMEKNKLSEIFELIQEMKEFIADSSVGHSSLEEIFFKVISA